MGPKSITTPGHSDAQTTLESRNDSVPLREGPAPHIVKGASASLYTLFKNAPHRSHMSPQQVPRFPSCCWKPRLPVETVMDPDQGVKIRP